MRRLLLSTFVCLPLAAAPLAAQDPTITDRTPAFHAGQWAAEVSLETWNYGIGALRFTSPNTAWTLNGVLSGIRSKNGPSFDATHLSLGIGLEAGKRFYRPGHGRIRPFRTIGGFASLGLGRDAAPSAPTYTTRDFGIGIFGDLGASVFVAPELSLSAKWRASVGASWERGYVDGNLSATARSFGLSAGGMTLFGTFYF
ncbi:MAG TPA: hypothetical protein VGR13_08595 [Actinomycetota bacterium]|jgi:hypothetical protein|nr:hypothetical protein [Actinomycetota bacterium]